MAKIRLTYFQAKGRAELARLILAQAGVDYDDHRISKEQWADVKASTPLGQVPVLEFNGETIAQSMTIARFLAKEFNFAGKDNLEQAKTDMIAETVQDLINTTVSAALEKDEELKKTKMAKLNVETIPAFLATMERLLKANGGKYFVGGEVTYADLAVFNILNIFHEDMKIDYENEYIKQYCQTIADLPKIKAYIETRPKPQ